MKIRKKKKKSYKFQLEKQVEQKYNTETALSTMSCLLPFLKQFTFDNFKIKRNCTKMKIRNLK